MTSEHDSSTEAAIASQSSVVLADKAAAILDHLIGAIEHDVELPTVIRQNGGLRQRATDLYLAVDAFHRELARLAGDEERAPSVPPYSHSHDASLHGLVRQEVR